MKKQKDILNADLNKTCAHCQFSIKTKLLQLYSDEIYVTRRTRQAPVAAATLDV